MISRRMLRRVPALALSLLLLAPGCAVGQRTDVIRGRVADGSGRAVSGADVVATRAYDLQTFDTTTDAAGRYQLTITHGRQDYLLFVSKPGFKPFQKRVRPVSGDSIIQGDAMLVPAPPPQLNAMRSQAVPNRPPRRDYSMNGGPGSDQMNNGGVRAGLTPDQMGDLNAIAQLMPGMASGTMFGLPADGNGTLLDGLSFQGGTLPRDASVHTQIASSAYDASRGGFSGVQVTTTLDGGSVMSQRMAHVTLDAPVLQYNDPVAERLGGRFVQTSVGGGASGATAFEHVFYNVAGQYTRRLGTTSDLLTADPRLAYAAGLAPDSARRLIAAAEAAGIPVGPPGFSTDQVTDNVVFLGRFDTPKSMNDPGSKNLWSLLLYGNVSHRQALGVGATTAPSVGHDANSAILTARLVRSVYFGPHDSWLNETRSGFTSNTSRTSPWIAAPAAVVMVASSFADGSGAVSSVALGGAGNDGSRNRSWTWETTNTTQWYSRGHAGTIKLYVDSRLDGYNWWSPGTDLGAFTYGSVADLAANQPASYTRTVQSPAIAGNAWSGVLALGDLWRSSATFELEGGLRLEENRYFSPPPANSKVASALGISNDAVPNTLHLSPRLGFTWAIARGQTTNQAAVYSNGTGAFYQGPYGVLRGGVGEWRSALAPTLLSGAEAATGLAGASRTVSCIGAATPTPDWSAYAASQASVPSQCLDGSSGVFSDAAPNVRLFDPSYTAGRSWRANLIWESRVPGFRYRLDGTYALNLNQPGTYNLNFVNVPSLSLADEGNRPVYVPVSSIVPATGGVSPVDARVTPMFGTVSASRSDLRGTARQFTVQITPDFAFSAFDEKNPPFWQALWRRMYVSAAYTYADVRSDARGFDGATAGDPTALSWASGTFTPRHQIQLQFGILGPKGISLGAYAVVASGLPYTPMVGSDINGDGYANDQAYVFNPATAPLAIASQLRSLLAQAPGAARACLERQVGSVAGRNSCAGPWSTALNLRLSFPNRIPLWAGRWADIGVNLANPLGGLDQLLHGADNLRGWGTNASPDRTLYYVRGFDPATRSFTYEVNPRFGSTRASQNTIRAPFRLTVDLSLYLGRPYQLLMLDRSMALVRRLRNDPKGAVDTLRVRFAANLPDMYNWVIGRADSLLLSPEQLDSLSAAAVPYRKSVDSLVTQLALYVAALPEDFNTQVVVKEQNRMLQMAWNAARDQRVPIARILSPQQYKALPPYITSILNAVGDVKTRYIMIF